MKKIGNILISAMFLITGLFLGACATTTYAEQEKPLKIWYENENGYMHTYQLIDENTGVNYVVVSTERGNGEMSCAITARLNPDGTLYVSK